MQRLSHWALGACHRRAPNAFGAERLPRRSLDEGGLDVGGFPNHLVGVRFSVKRLRPIALALIFSACFPVPLRAGIAPDRHVVLIIWDGMRPDLVTERNTPALWKLSQEGVVFRNSHCVYFSATNVNGVAIATGMYPAHNGLLANHEFRPGIDSRKPVDMENPKVVSKGDELTNGKYIAAPTIAELVQQSGGRSVIAAAKTVGLLHDRPRGDFPNQSVTLSAGVAWPNESTTEIVKAFGPFPASHGDRDVWTTNVLTQLFWKDTPPPFSVLWLGQPDLTQHETAPGAPAALRAIKQSDDNLARVLSALKKRTMREFTDIFITSDHGFSTIEREVELPNILRDAGFDVATELKSDLRPGEIMIVGGGGSVLFYVGQNQSALLQRLIEFLQHSDFAGLIFTKAPAEGTFPLSQARIDTADAPDAVLAFRWNDRPNQYGVPGLINGDWQRAAGKGTHATLSRFDMHNTLIAAGPHLRRGQVDDLPAGNIDVAPTILKILGIQPPRPMDGRVLTEALTDGNQAAASPKPEVIEATRRFPNGVWRQSLRLSHLGDTTYLDEGNGGFEPAK